MHVQRERGLVTTKAVVAVHELNLKDCRCSAPVVDSILASLMFTHDFTSKVSNFRLCLFAILERGMKIQGAKTRDTSLVLPGKC